MDHDHECKKLNYISLWLWRNWNFTTCICSCSLRHCFSHFSHSWHADFSGALTSSNGRISLPLHSTPEKEEKPYNPWEETIIFFLPLERRLHSRSFSYETWRPQIPRPSLRWSLHLRWKGKDPASNKVGQGVLCKACLYSTKHCSSDDVHWREFSKL